jgi:hypothetical protein
MWIFKGIATIGIVVNVMVWSTIPILRGRHYDCCAQHVHVELSFTGCIFGSYEKPWTFALMQGCLELLDCTLLSYCQHH